MSKFKKSLGLPIALVATAAFMRFIPHPPNFTPLIAIGLFSAVEFKKQKSMALLIPIVALLLSDVFINRFMMGSFTLSYSGVTWNYLALLLVPLAGILIMRKLNLKNLAFSFVSGNILFFLVSNLGVWLSFGMYPATPGGLAACYIAGLPFLANQLIATLLWGIVLFGASSLLRTGNLVPQFISIKKS